MLWQTVILWIMHFIAYCSLRSTPKAKALGIHEYDVGEFAYDYVCLVSLLFIIVVCHETHADPGGNRQPNSRDMYRQRGLKFAPPTSEFVEWLNSLTSVIWSLINPQMVCDTFDVFRTSLPDYLLVHLYRRMSLSSHCLAS